MTSKELEAILPPEPVYVNDPEICQLPPEWMEEREMNQLRPDDDSQLIPEDIEESDLGLAQVISVGQIRYGRIGTITTANAREESSPVTYPSTTRIVIYQNYDQGTHATRRLDDSPILPDEYPHQPHDHYTHTYDLANEAGQSMTTTRKQKTSQRGYPASSKRIPDHQAIKKPAHSFRLTSTYGEIYGHEDAEPEVFKPQPEELDDIPW